MNASCILYGYCLNADLWYKTHGSLKCEVSGPSLYYVAIFLNMAPEQGLDATFCWILKRDINSICNEPFYTSVLL